MISNLKLAWRNLWRNKRRTLITIASVFFGVLLSTIMSSMQEGSYNSMISNMVKFYSGYLQIQNEDYWENKTINEAMEPTKELYEIASSTPEITYVTSRLESFALASSNVVTRGVMVFGVEPEAEDKITELSKWIVEGTYFQSGNDGVLLGKDLAKYLNLTVNDTLVLIGSGYHGAGAAGKYPILGILKFPNPQLNKQSIYMNLPTCQELFSAPGLVTSLILMVEDQYHLRPALRKLKSKIASPYTVMSWEEMNPDLLQMVEGDKAGAAVMKAILYILIGFGIFGTIMMMVIERTREMGVMVAIGMQRLKLATIMFFETVFIGFLGVISGFLVSIPLIIFFLYNPILLTGNMKDTMEQFGMEPYMYFSAIPSVFYHQLIIVFALSLLIALYPLLIALKLKVHVALRA